MKVGTALKEELDRTLLGLLTGTPRELYTKLAQDRKLAAWQNQANHVSIVRLGYNDHGPVHMRIVAINALKILALLNDAGVPPSFAAEQLGSFEDAQTAVVLAAMFHDVGMAVARQAHEWHSLQIGMPIVEAYLAEFYPDHFAKQIALSSMIMEAIVGHMGHERVHSVEAGTLLVADGTDMTKGRARIAKLLAQKPTLGDMHRHSADAIKDVQIIRGENRPVHIQVKMDDYSGIFQVEEVLMGKLHHSPIQQHVELSVIVHDDAPRRYL
jgi:uncharacterized protein